MKYLATFSLLLVSPLLAQTEELPPTGELRQDQRNFLNLPQEEREEFTEHYREAFGYFQQKRIFEALESLGEASKILENEVAILNLYGSCYVEMRAFDKALTAFRRARELDPENQSVNFNIAEILFVTRQWQEAHDAFGELFKKINQDDISLSRLIEFKMFLCKIKLNKEAEVIALSEKYDYQDDSPFFYFAKAAIAYQSGDKETAAEWIARAKRIFRDPQVISPWEDTLVEFGYIKSFYGEQELIAK